MSFKQSVRFSMALFSLLLIAQLAFSQGMMMATPEERAKRLKERLTLTDDQTKKVQEIFKNSDKERQSKAESVRGDRDAMRELMTSIMAGTDKEIEKVLTEEQKKKYDDLKKERRMRRGQRNRESAQPDSAKS